MNELSTSFCCNDARWCVWFWTGYSPKRNKADVNIIQDLTLLSSFCKGKRCMCSSRPLRDGTKGIGRARYRSIYLFHLPCSRVCVHYCNLLFVLHVSMYGDKNFICETCRGKLHNPNELAIIPLHIGHVHASAVTFDLYLSNCTATSKVANVRSMFRLTDVLCCYLPTNDCAK